MRHEPAVAAAGDVAAMDREAQQRESRVTLAKLLLIIPVMLAFCAGMVPLYKQICQVMGITASREVAGNTQIDTTRIVKVEFDANINNNFAWKFVPVEHEVALHPGAIATINYRVTNTLPYATTGRAVPSYGPIEAGLYFKKISCFCFSNQTLQAGETRDMPVTFLVDPKMPRDIGSIALSYTFFDVSNERSEQKKS